MQAVNISQKEIDLREAVMAAIGTCMPVSNGEVLSCLMTVVTMLLMDIPVDKRDKVVSQIMEEIPKAVKIGLALSAVSSTDTPQ